MTLHDLRTTNADKGFAILTATILLAIVLVFSLSLLDYSLSGRNAGRRLQQSISAEEIASAGIDKAIYCLNATAGTNCGGTYGTGFVGQTGVSYGGGTFTTTVTVAGADRDLVSTGTAQGGGVFIVKARATTIPPTDTPEFSYALQAGAGGAHMANNSTVNGTIYSNGDITCQSTNAIITGDAFSTKAGGLIDACRTNFDSHADRILNGKVDRHAYFMNSPADIAGTTVTGTKYPNSTTPTVAPMPGLNLEFWEDSAEAGGTITGNYSPADNSHMGPVKITGNLTMNNNIDVIIDGPVWVMGNITTGNNVSFTMNASFGSFSTVILADSPTDPATYGKIDISNNTGIYGSGDPRSHILFASTNTSTNDASPALMVSNNASGAVFYAINGTLRIANNGGAKSLAGYRLYLDENSTVTYVESDFTGQFSNSPTGSWRVKEGLWREAK